MLNALMTATPKLEHGSHQTPPILDHPHGTNTNSISARNHYFWNGRAPISKSSGLYEGIDSWKSISNNCHRGRNFLIISELSSYSMSTIGSKEEAIMGQHGQPTRTRNREIRQSPNVFRTKGIILGFNPAKPRHNGIARIASM